MVNFSLLIKSLSASFKVQEHGYDHAFIPLADGCCSSFTESDKIKAIVVQGLENGRAFSSQGKSRNFDHTEKVREFYPKYRKNMENYLINKLKKDENGYLGFMAKFFSLASLGIPVLVSTDLSVIAINNELLLVNL